MKNAILNNLGLKLLALILAIATWAYIVIELQSGTLEEKEILKNVLPYRMISKKLPIELNLVGEVPDGYAVVHDEIIITPANFVIVGPKAVLGELSVIETQPVHIEGNTKTITRNITIIPPAKGIIKEKFIRVTIPIVKVTE
ncbi:MAG: YbbR-like domain-containing protein [Candidatus Omnitrophota bacterium]